MSQFAKYFVTFFAFWGAVLGCVSAYQAEGALDDFALHSLLGAIIGIVVGKMLFTLIMHNFVQAVKKKQVAPSPPTSNETPPQLESK